MEPLLCFMTNDVDEYINILALFTAFAASVTFYSRLLKRANSSYDGKLEFIISLLFFKRNNTNRSNLNKNGGKNGGTLFGGHRWEGGGGIWRFYFYEK